MKTISSRFLKAAVAMLLIVLMIFGSTVSSFAAVVDKAETEADLTNDKYFFLKPSTNWAKDGARFAAYFFNNSTNKNTWVSATKVTDDTSYYYVKVPSGTWPNMIWCRMNPSNTTNNWNNKWNQSGDLTWGGSDNTNLLTVPSNSWNDFTTTWGEYTPPSTGSLTASSSTVNTGTAVTLTPKLTSNADLNEINSTSYSISPSSGASVSGNTFTATAAGTYTVTATITYELNDSSTNTKTVTATTTITVKSNTHTVTYNANGGTGAPQSATVNAGSSHTVSSTVPTYTGYNFKGWNAAADGSGSTYTAGQTITVNSNITLYAQWAKVHTITYDADGGSGAPANGSAEDGTDYDIPDTVPTKADHNFTGWKDQNDTTYAAGDTISAVSSDMTLTAQWELASVCSPVMAGLTLEINETGKVEATTNDFCTGGKTFTYTLVDGDEFIILNDDQTVTPKKPGTAHVKATCACGKEVTCAVTVNEPDLYINPEEVALLIGQSMTEAFKASANVGNPSVTFKSKDDGIATVTNGKATAVAEGNVDIEASLKFNDYYTATICAKVSVSTPEITADPTSVALEFGEGATATSKTVTITTNADAGNKTGDDVTVTSASTSVATATISGSTITITATGAGSTTVTAKFHDATVSIPVTVTQYDPYFTIYLTNNKSYSTPNLWYWDDNQNGNGVNMVYIGKNDSSQSIFAYRFLKTEIPDNIIFRDGDWKAKTNDIDLESLRTTDNNITADSAAFSLDGNNSPYTAKSWAIDIKLPTVSVADVVVPVAGTETATATVTNGGKVLWKSQGTSIATIADVDTQTSTVTGVTPGDTTITARAFVDTANSSIKTLPTNYKTDTACWPFISTEATANVKVGSVNYDIAVNAETGGTASIIVGGVDKGDSATIAHGTEYTLKAVANEGYRFVEWIDVDGTRSTEPEFTVSANETMDYTAKFVKTYKVTVNFTEGIELIKFNNIPYNQSFENITVDEGAEITVYATPAEGYAFLNWTTDDVTLVNPTEALITISNIDRNLTLTANAVKTYSASVNVQTNKYFDTYGGNVTINGENVTSKQCLPGETVKFEATPNTNYYFAGWYSDVEFTNLVSADSNYETSMTEDGITLYGLFVKDFYLKNHDTGEIDVTFKYDIATNSYYSDDTDYVEKFIVTSNDGVSVDSTDVTVSKSSCVGLTNVSGHYTSHYVLTPDTENYDIESPVTYTLTPDMNAQGTPDGTYTLSIALSDAEKVVISLDGTKIAEKAIGSTFTHKITPPEGQYLSSVTTEPDVKASITDNTVTFKVPETNVNIVPAFTNYSYVKFSNETTGLNITGLKEGYKAGEEVTITVTPASEQVTISAIVADNAAAVVTDNGTNWTITIASMPADTTITLTTTVDAKFIMDYGMTAIGNYGSGYTTYGTVAMKIGDTTLSKGGYADKTETVTYTATPNANFIFDGWYSGESCETSQLLSRETSYDVTPTKDTTVYALFVPRHYLAPDQSKVATHEEMTYEPETRTFHYTSSTISKGAHFRVSNRPETSYWTDSNSYARFDSSFNVTFNANAYMVTVGWGTQCYALNSDSTAEYPFEIIVEINGNSSIDVSCKANKIGNSVYLSSGRLDLPGSYNASVFETEFEFTHIEKTANPAVSEVKDGDEIREKYMRLNLPEAEMVSFQVEITGTAAPNYEVDSFVVYHINTESYTIVTPQTLGNNKYAGSVFVDGDAYIVPIYFLTEEYAEANNLAEIDIYFDATAIKDQAWGPFVACYAWGSKNTEYNGGWSGQMMIPSEDGLSFYTMLTVPKSDDLNATSIPNGVTFNNYMQSTVPGSNPGAFSLSATQYQCYDYREPITLYEGGYEVITFVAKDSTDGYHGDRGSGVTVNTVTSTTTDIFNKYHFDYLYSRDGKTPMDLNGEEIENPVNLKVGKADYYIVNKGDIKYDPTGTKYVGDEKYDADWAVDWYIFDSTGKYITNILSTAMWDDKDNNLDELYTYLHEALNTNADDVAGKTVAITYEHENNAGHQISYDGQWYGNMLDHTLDADVKVGLLGEDNNTYEIDDDNVADYGEGYLVDENDDKHASLEITMDLGEASLSAVHKDGYRFIGWHTLQPNGSYKLISNAYDYTTYINNNTTYYAIFKAITEGQVIINHSVYKNTDPYIPDHGGVSEMSIEVEYPDGHVEKSTPSTSRSTITIDVEDTKTYKIRIITTPLMNGQFYAWYTDSENSDGTKTYEEILTDPNVIGKTQTVVTEFEYYYDIIQNPQKNINIYSDVRRVSNKANLYYKYKNRYGDIKTYTVKDYELTDAECTGYEGNKDTAYCPTFLTLCKGKDPDNKDIEIYLHPDSIAEYEEKGYRFVDTYNLIEALAPKEQVTEAFGQKIKWLVTEVNLTTESSEITLVATQDDLEYTLNYDMPGDNGGSITKYYNELVEIEAPAEYDGRPFSYWKDTGTGEILSYNRFYNYRIVEDKNIEAIYGANIVSDWTPSVNSVTYTREFDDNGDYIYTDFLLAYNSRTGEKISELLEAGKDVQYGFMLVRDSSYFVNETNYNNIECPEITSSMRNALEEVAYNEKAAAHTIGEKTYNIYFYELTGQPVTNFNRCDAYLRYDNTKVVKNHYYREYAFTAVAYMFVDDVFYLSNGVDVNFYKQATVDPVKPEN